MTREASAADPDSAARPAPEEPAADPDSAARPAPEEPAADPAAEEPAADQPAADPDSAARPARYDAATALIVVDVQNDFADPSGSLYVRDGEGVLPFINGEVEAAVVAGAHVFYTQDWHPPRTPHFAKDGGIWPVHCVAGSWGARFHPELAVRGPVVRKGSRGEDGYSGFTVRDPETGQTQPTELPGLLREAGVERVVVAGLATDYCVRATALDALAEGYPTTVLESGIRAVDLAEGDGARALADLRAAGADVVPADDTDLAAAGKAD
jgi:nicotinamidase/pyrazinamidase